MLCPLYGYPFDRAFSAQIAHSVPKVVRGTTDATLPCRGGGHSGSQGKTGSVFLWGDASGKYHPLDLRCWDEPFFGSMYKLLIQEHRLCRLGKSFYCFIAA